MSVNNTTTKTGFFKSIGNWFNKNGSTVGKSMQLAGQTAMGVGLMGMMFRAMDKSNSGCCCGGGASIWGGGFGGCCSPWNMGGCGAFGGMGMFSGMSMLNNMYGGGMTNPYLTMAGLSGASNYAFNNTTLASHQNMTANPLYQSFYNQSYQKYYSQLTNNQTGITNPDEEVDYTAVENGEIALTTEELQNTDDGENMNTAFNNGKSFKYAEKDATAEQKQEGLEKYAKSYLAYIDSNEGDGDGLISEDEFVEHKSNGTEQANTISRKIFKQFDLDNSGSLGWREYAALMKTYDKNGDGVITAQEYKDAVNLSKDSINSAIRRNDGDKDRFRNQLKNSSNELGYSS